MASQLGHDFEQMSSSSALAGNQGLHLNFMSSCTLNVSRWPVISTHISPPSNLPCKCRQAFHNSLLKAVLILLQLNSRSLGLFFRSLIHLWLNFRQNKARRIRRWGKTHLKEIMDEQVEKRCLAGRTLSDRSASAGAGSWFVHFMDKAFRFPRGKPGY